MTESLSGKTHKRATSTNFQRFLFDEVAANVTGMRVGGDNTLRSVSILTLREKARRKAEMEAINKTANELDESCGRLPHQLFWGDLKGSRWIRKKQTKKNHC